MAMPANVAWGYLHLLGQAWDQTPCGTLPNDDELLSILAQMEPLNGLTKLQYFIQEKFKILSPFRLNARDDRWHNNDMKKVAARVRKVHKAHVDKGKRGAKARWSKHSPANSSASSWANSPTVAISTLSLSTNARAREGTKAPSGSGATSVYGPPLDRWLISANSLGIGSDFAAEKWHAMNQVDWKGGQVNPEAYLDRVAFWWAKEVAKTVQPASSTPGSGPVVVKKSGGESTWGITQKIRALEEELPAHPGNPRNRTGMQQASAEDRADFAAIENQIKDLRRQMQ